MGSSLINNTQYDVSPNAGQALIKYLGSDVTILFRWAIAVHGGHGNAVFLHDCQANDDEYTHKA